MSEDSVYYYLHPKYYQRSHWYWILGHIFRHKKYVLSITILSLIAIGIQTYIPVLFGQAIDTAIANKNTNLLLNIATVIVVLGIIRGLIGYIAAIQNEVVAQKVEMQVRQEFFDNLSRKNMDFFNKARVGDLMSQATQDTTNLTFAISPGLRSVITAVVGLFAAGAAMIYLSTALSLVFAIIFPVYVYFLYRYAKRLQPISLERQERLAKINAGLQENLTGIRVVRTFSAQEREKEVFTQDIREYEDVLIRRGAISAYFIPTLLLGLATSIVFLLGIYIIEATQAGIYVLSIGSLILNIQPLTTGELIAFITLIQLLAWPTQILRFLLDVIMLGFAGSSRIFATLTTKSILEQGDQLELKDIKGGIEFKNVSFTYEKFKRSTGTTEGPSQLAISNFSLKVKPGEVVAIIGPTGSGKTTIGRLLIRLYDLTEGEILIDGHNIRDLSLRQLRKIVGFIEQDVFLFSTTIKANIAYGMKEINDDLIVDASKTAQAHEFIIEFRDQYDTIVGERGVTLSGGQKQRIAMARTFVMDPKILIMDDSTSAVDAETEAKIQSALNTLVKNRTTLIITHRLSTLKNADRIVFLRKGKIERIGTHEELLTTFEPYREIFASYIDLPPVQPLIQEGVD